MRKFISYVCCFIIVLSSVWMGASVFAKEAMKNSLVSIAIDEIKLEEKINAFFMDIDIPGKELAKQELEMFAKNIAKDETINAEANKYVDMVIDAILYDGKGGDGAAFNKAIKTEILSYSDDISALSKNAISEEEVRSIINVSLQEVDFESAFEDTIQQLKTRFSATEKLMLKTLRFLEDDVSFVASLACVIAFSMLLFSLNIAYLTGLLYLGVSYALSAGVLVFAKVCIPIAFKFVLSQASTNDEIVASASHLGRISGYFVIAAAVCFIFKVIYQRLFLKE